MNEVSTDQRNVKDAIKKAGRFVERGFWYGYTALSEAKATEISRAGTLRNADMKALEEIAGRKLTKANHWLWETPLRTEITSFVPMESA